MTNLHIDLDANRLLDVVAIDGPAGAGKSTIARLVAQKLGFTFLDTGAMYRAIALGLLQASIDLADHSSLNEFLKSARLDIKISDSTMGVFLNDRDLTEAIRMPDMGARASDASKVQEIRWFCSRMQRDIGKRGRIVAEGRDMGSVVFPDAKWKFFLTATPESRAHRRYLEEIARNVPIGYDQILQGIQDRDAQDMSRPIAPLVQARDACVVDSSDLTVSQVVETFLEWIRKNP